MKKGTCKLCLAETELCNSHIIPEFAYKNIYDKSKGNNQLFMQNIEKGAKLERTKYQKGFREYLLCKKCENKFSVYEKYVVEVLRNNIPNLTYDIEFKVDYYKFKMFELSILWRCGITSITNFKLELGVKHTENLRLILNNNEKFDFWQYGCSKFILQKEDRTKFELIFVSGGNHIKGINGFKIHFIYFWGIEWIYFVGSKSHRLENSNFEQSFLLPNGELKVFAHEIKYNKVIMSNANLIFN